MISSNNHYDLIIVGGGLVGASLAKALAHLSLRIAIIEAKAPLLNENLNHDPRAIALSFGSWNILANLGLSNDLLAHCCAIKKIHVSDQGHFGSTIINAQTEQVPALGYVIPIEKLNVIMQQQLSIHDNVDQLQPATVTDFSQPLTADESWQISVQHQNQLKKLQTKLLIAADGSDSMLRKLNNIQCEEKSYHQQAIISLISLNQSHQNTAFERFIKNGSIALLPHPGLFASLVWAVNPLEAKRLLDLSDPDFLIELQNAFGYRLGKFSAAGKRYTFPLKFSRAAQSVKPGFILLGNAAQTIHPIAAQGFNLSLRNVALLADLLKTALAEHKSVNDLNVLCAYEQQCQNNQNSTIALTQFITKIFGHNQFPLQPLRNMGLILLDILPTGKKRFAKRCMGIEGK